MVALHAIRKSYGGTRALDGVGLELRPGSVHALLGGNGSGKSTAIKVMAGVVRADDGRIDVDGVSTPAGSWTPSHAKTAGLRFVHQESRSFPSLTVAENLAIGSGFETGFPARIRWRATRRRTQHVLERFAIAATPEMQLSQLGPATQTMVAIARALQDVDDEKRSVLVLDEPTAALPAREVELLLDAVKGFAADGHAILFVTHRLTEALEIADYTTVLRDGRVVGELGRDAMTHDTLVELIAGHVLDETAAGTGVDHADGEEAVRLDGVAAGAVCGATLSVRKGEIVGIAGLLGSGRSTLLRCLFGDIPLERGHITLGGEAVAFTDPRDALRAGVAFVPEDRATESAFRGLTLSENMSIAVLPGYWRRGLLQRRRLRADSRELMSRFLIRAASEVAELGTLSGGNQQKAILARSLRRRPGLILLDEPTQGVDVGAKAEIWSLVRRAVDAGAAVIVVSSELEELESVCDRVVVLDRGRTTSELVGAAIDADRLHALIHGSAIAR